MLDSIKEDYKLTSLSEKKVSNPPVRGPYGDCVFNILNNKPRKQRPFRLVGEREAALRELVELFILDPDKPFFLRTDASNYAVGAVLEQVDKMGTITGVAGSHYPIAFWSRKLSKGQHNWAPREKEAYAIICALVKWAGSIGLQHVDVLTDHQSLERWHSEHVDTPSGPSGRRGRWHELLSKFNLSVTYLPGKLNPVADATSRWMYPARNAFQDVSKHGCVDSAKDMKEIIRQEREEELAWISTVRVVRSPQGGQWW